MKVFITSVILLVATSFVSAAELSASAIIRADAENIFNNAHNQIEDAFNGAASTFQTASGQIHSATVAARNKLVDFLNALGSEGAAFATEVSVDIDMQLATLSDLANIYSDTLLRNLPTIKQTFDMYLPSNIDTLITHVEHNSLIAKCWDKVATQSLLDTVVGKIIASIAASSSSITTQSTSAAGEFGNGITVNLNAATESCNSENSCILKYFVDNRWLLNQNFFEMSQLYLHLFDIARETETNLYNFLGDASPITASIRETTEACIRSVWEAQYQNP